MLKDIEISAGLERFEEDWVRAGVAREDACGEISDGVYEAVIEDAWVVESAATGTAALVWKFRIPGPRPGGRVLTKSRRIGRETLSLLRRDLEKCGLVLNRLGELPGRTGEMIGNRVGLAKRTRNGRVCFYLRWPAPQGSPVSLRFLRAMMLNSCPPDRTSKRTLRLLKPSATWSSECRTA